MQLHGGRTYLTMTLGGMLNDACLTALGQCLNDIETTTGKATPHKVTVYGGSVQDLFHVSAGKIGTNKTCSLFYVKNGVTAMVVGVFQHSSSTTYSKVWSRGTSKTLPNSIDLNAKSVTYPLD
jgi:hypothetical protein